MLQRKRKLTQSQGYFQSLLLGFSLRNQRTHLYISGNRLSSFTTQKIQISINVFMILLVALQLLPPFDYFSLAASTAENDGICFKQKQYKSCYFNIPENKEISLMYSRHSTDQLSATLHTSHSASVPQLWSARTDIPVSPCS